MEGKAKSTPGDDAQSKLETGTNSHLMVMKSIAYLGHVAIEGVYGNLVPVPPFFAINHFMVQFHGLSRNQSITSGMR